MGLTDKLAPAEVAVVGSLLIDERCAGVVFSRARPEHFRDEGLRRLFTAARRLWGSRKPMDPVTIGDEAGGRDGELIAECMRRTPTAANVEEYLRILEDNARLVQIQDAAMQLLSCQTVAEASALYEKIGQKLLRAGRIESVAWVDCLSEYLDRMHDPTPPDYLTWSLPEIDRKLHVSPGDFVIIGAESSAGKTALALQFAYAQAAAGRPVGFFSLETPRERLTNRLMAETQVAGISMDRTKLKQLSPRDFERAGDAGIRADRVPLRIIRNAYRLEDIRNETIVSGYQVIYVDYLQLIRYPSASRYETVTNVSMELHRLAGELGVTVVALSQVTNSNKGQGRKAATKDDLRESDQLLQDAEIVMMLNISGPVSRVLSIEKNKDEGKIRFDLSFDPRHMQFGYLPPPKSGKGKPHPDNVSFDDLDPDEGGPLPF